jgi:hypothetical protein
MDAGGINQNTVGSAVWTSTPRSLTRLGTTLLTASTSIQTAIAASTSVDLRPAASISRRLLVAVIEAVGSGVNIEAYDGTSGFLIVQGTGSGAAYSTPATTSTVGLRVRNIDASNAGKYSYYAEDWAI